MNNNQNSLKRKNFITLRLINTYTISFELAHLPLIEYHARLVIFCDAYNMDSPRVTKKVSNENLHDSPKYFIRYISN